MEEMAVMAEMERIMVGRVGQVQATMAMSTMVLMVWGLKRIPGTTMIRITTVALGFYSALMIPTIRTKERTTMGTRTATIRTEVAM